MSDQNLALAFISVITMMCLFFLGVAPILKGWGKALSLSCAAISGLITYYLLFYSYPWVQESWRAALSNLFS